MRHYTIALHNPSDTVDRQRWCVERVGTTGAAGGGDVDVFLAVHRLSLQALADTTTTLPTRTTKWTSPLAIMFGETSNRPALSYETPFIGL